MERALSPEEKIKRAEEIYYRRKLQNDGKNCARVNVAEGKKDLRLFKKMITQILICAIIYTSFYIIKNKNYIFSDDVINKTKEILSYDINLLKIYEEIKEYLNSFTYEDTDVVEEQLEGETQEDVQNIETSENINTQEINESQEVTKIEDAIGGEIIEEAPVVELTQMEQDAKDIINTKSLIIPLKGTITSRFGQRESDNPIVSKNHTGIDIAVNEGTVFISAMYGVVEEVSSTRRIRKSYKNCKWRYSYSLCTL